MFAQLQSELSRNHIALVPIFIGPLFHSITIIYLFHSFLFTCIILCNNLTPIYFNVSNNAFDVIFVFLAEAYKHYIVVFIVNLCLYHH